MIQKFFRTLMLERPARKYDFAGWAVQLEQDGQKLAQKFVGSAETPKNRKTLRHVIGIERWAQSRIKVAFGAPLIQDEHDGYKPDSDATWDDIRQQFSETRAESVSLAQQLAAANTPITTTIRHNQFGDVTIRGWLRYIFMHGSFEARGIK